MGARLMSRLRTGRVTAIGTLVAATAVLAACSSGGGATSSGSSGSSGSVTTVTVAASAFIGQVAEQIPALDPSICAPYGIKLNLVSVNDAAAAAGLENGSIQFGYFTSVLGSISQGQAPGVVVLAYGGRAPTNAGGIWGPPSITSPSQLVGKSLDGLAGGPDALNTLLMNSVGIKSSQYSVVQFGQITAYFDAPTTGKVDAAWDVAPLPPSWVAAKFHNIIPLTAADGYTQDMWITASKSYATAHPAVVENFLRCWAAGLKAGRSTSASTRSTLAAAIAKYDLISQSEALQVLSAYPQADALETPNNITEAVKSTTFYLGSPASQSALQPALAPQYLAAAGVSVTPSNPAGPTTW